MVLDPGQQEWYRRVEGGLSPRFISNHISLIPSERESEWENTNSNYENNGWIIPNNNVFHHHQPRQVVRTHPRAHALAPQLNTQNFVTYSHIPYHRARYIPENMIDGKIMHVYNKATLDKIHRTQGVSPYTRRAFSGGQKVPRRLRTEYIKQHRRQIQQNVMDELNRRRSRNAR
jgi:hypothetical protein